MGKAFKDMSVGELKDYALSLYDVIYIAECYGVTDLLNYEGIISELVKRGYQIQENTKLVIMK